MLTAVIFQNFEKTYQLYDRLHRYCTAAFIAFLIVSVVLFLAFHVPQILKKMMGRSLTKVKKNKRKVKSVCLWFGIGILLAGMTIQTAKAADKSHKEGNVRLTFGLTCTREDPLVLTYGANPAELVFSLKNGDTELKEEIKRIEIVTNNKDAVEVTADRYEQKLTCKAKQAKEGLTAVKLSVRTDKHQCSTTLYMRTVSAIYQNKTTGEQVNRFNFDGISEKKSRKTEAQNTSAQKEENQNTRIAAGEIKVSDYITLNEKASAHVYKDEENDAFYYGKNAHITFRLSGEYNKIYLENGKDITEEGIYLEEGRYCGDKKRFFLYLTRENGMGTNTETVTEEKTGLFALTFIYDSEAPQCEAIDFGAYHNVYTDLTTDITFSVYDNKQVTARVSCKDRASGVEGWSFYVAKVKDDSSYESLLTEEDFAPDLTGRHFSEGTQDQVIKVGEIERGQITEGKYVVFVKVMDHVGNIKIYGSDGVVIDTHHNITANIEKKTQDSKGIAQWQNRYWYTGNTELVLNAEETATEGGCYSGMGWIKYTVLRSFGDGKTVTEKEQTVFGDKPEQVTLKELQTFCTMQKNLLFTDKKRSSQMITVGATAADQAGNCGQQPAEYRFVIDSLAPKFVTSVFFQVNHQGKFLNGCYANSKVTYTASVKERFLKEILVSVNGTEYTLKELQAHRKELGISSVVMEETPDITKTTDESTYSFSVEFAADGTYDVHATAYDASGNMTEDKGCRFIIDTVCPELEVTYTAYRKDGTSSALKMSEQRIYIGEEFSHITAEAVIRESNFAAKDGVLTCSAKNSRGQNVTVRDYRKAFQGKWNNTGWVSESDRRNVLKLKLPDITVDANYEFVYSVKDLAGNGLEEDLKHFLTLDRKKPAGTVNADYLVQENGSGMWRKLIQKITFGQFGKNSVRITMEGEDETSGIASIYYLQAADGLKKEELEKRYDWKIYKKELTYRGSQKLVLYEKITDIAGNVQYISSDGIIVDDTSPVLTVTLTPEEASWGRGIYNAGDKPGLFITARDPEVKGVSAGLKKIICEIKDNTTGRTEKKILAEISKTAQSHEWSGHMDIDTSRIASNDVQITVSVQDWSGNTSFSPEKHLKIDNTAPKVSFSLDRSGIQNGKYFQNERKLTVTVEEDNFDDTYRPEVTSSSGGGYTISPWKHEGSIHTTQLTFSGDSDYSVSYVCYDLAGNRSNAEKQDTFIVDRTKPVINVSFENAEVGQLGYYKTERTAVISVKEHNFDPAQIHIYTTASSSQAPQIGSWVSHGDMHTAKLHFTHDAVYTLQVEGMDLAGNTAGERVNEQFTLDKTSPDIAISGVKDKSANSRRVAPAVTISDTNIELDTVQITLTGANTGKHDINTMASVHTEKEGMVVQFYDFAKGMDDIYLLSCKAADKAGNEIKTAVRFSVNRDGSVYELDEATQKLLKQRYIKKPQDLVITEINADNLQLTEISYSLEGQMTMLKQGSDYTIEKTGEEGQWKTYRYHIHAACFQKEGTYTLNIYSEDAANNRSTNKIKTKPLIFTLDYTAPVLVVSNLANGGKYKEEKHRFTINARDNISLDTVEVYLDGTCIHTYKKEELEITDGKLEIDIPESSQYQKVTLAAYDKAGNITREIYDAQTDTVLSAYRILVTTNQFIQFIHSLLAVTSIILTILSLITAYVFYRHHHRQKS